MFDRSFSLGSGLIFGSTGVLQLSIAFQSIARAIMIVQPCESNKKILCKCQLNTICCLFRNFIQGFSLVSHEFKRGWIDRDRRLIGLHIERVIVFEPFLESLYYGGFIDSQAVRKVGTNVRQFEIAELIDKSVFVQSGNELLQSIGDSAKSDAFFERESFVSILERHSGNLILVVKHSPSNVAEFFVEGCKELDLLGDTSHFDERAREFLCSHGGSLRVLFCGLHPAFNAPVCVNKRLSWIQFVAFKLGEIFPQFRTTHFTRTKCTMARIDLGSSVQASC